MRQMGSTLLPHYFRTTSTLRGVENQIKFDTKNGVEVVLHIYFAHREYVSV